MGKYQRSISACNYQFVPLVANTIYVHTYMDDVFHHLRGLLSAFLFFVRKLLFLANQSYRLEIKPDE